MQAARGLVASGSGSSVGRDGAGTGGVASDVVARDSFWSST